MLFYVVHYEVYRRTLLEKTWLFNTTEPQSTRAQENISYSIRDNVHDYKFYELHKRALRWNNQFFSLSFAHLTSFFYSSFMNLYKHIFTFTHKGKICLREMKYLYISSILSPFYTTKANTVWDKYCATIFSYFLRFSENGSGSRTMYVCISVRQ